MRASIILIFLFSCVIISKSASPLQCEGCVFLVSTIESWVQQNETETAIEKKFENLCKILGSNEQTVCKGLVDGGIPQIITLLAAKETPTQICGSNFNYCNATALKTNPPKKIVPFVKVFEVGGEIECEACHVIVRAIDSWLEQNKTKAQISKDLSSLCVFFTRETKTTCDGIASTDLDELIEWIEKAETPETVCAPAQLNYCPSQTKSSTSFWKMVHNRLAN